MFAASAAGLAFNDHQPILTPKEVPAVIGKWRISKDRRFWIVYDPRGEWAGSARYFNDAVKMVKDTPDRWLQRRCDRAALDAWVTEHQRLTA